MTAQLAENPKKTYTDIHTCSNCSCFYGNKKTVLMSTSLSFMNMTHLHVTGKSTWTFLLSDFVNPGQSIEPYTVKMLMIVYRDIARSFAKIFILYRRIA